MVDWRNIETLKLCQFIFNQTTVFMLGIYGWDFILSFQHVEGALISRKMKFRWPFVFYLYGRYAWLTEIVTMVVITHSIVSLDCEVAFRFLSILATSSVSCASTNLLIRTITIWRENAIVVLLLVVACLGHWILSIVVGAVKSNSNFSEFWQSCVFDYATSELIVFYVYTVVLDFSILALTVYGLCRQRALTAGSLWAKVCNQGLLYFLATLVVNVPVMIFEILDLNPVMTVLFSIPAATLSVIASSRAVISLVHLKKDSGNETTDVENSASPHVIWDAKRDRSSDSPQLTSNINLHIGSFRDSMDIEIVETPRSPPRSFSNYTVQTVVAGSSRTHDS
ncbi:hypothetical protein ABKN59_004956 [Abortiporus biennis]